MEYRELREKLTSGEIVDMTRKQLEEFISVATRERLTNSNHEISSLIMIDCAKTLLTVRCSQELHNNSIKIARFSLFVSLAGLILAGLSLCLNG